MTTPGATRRGDFLFDAFFSGAIGATAVALVLLALDALRGEPFLTPTLLGAELFTDTPAGQVTGARLEWMAYATAAHFVAFGVLGLVISALTVNVPVLRRNPILTTALLLVSMEVGIRLISLLLAPGLVPAVGASRILAANAVAAIAMGGFLGYAHREEVAEPPGTSTA
jgi:hypothetical protein